MMIRETSSRKRRLHLHSPSGAHLRGKWREIRDADVEKSSWIFLHFSCNLVELIHNYISAKKNFLRKSKTFFALIQNIFTIKSIFPQEKATIFRQKSKSASQKKLLLKKAKLSQWMGDISPSFSSKKNNLVKKTPTPRPLIPSERIPGITYDPWDLNANSLLPISGKFTTPGCIIPTFVALQGNGSQTPSFL